MLIEKTLDPGHLPSFNDTDMSQESVVSNARMIKYLHSNLFLQIQTVWSELIFPPK
jgi:hypothetical protein